MFLKLIQYTILIAVLFSAPQASAERWVVATLDWPPYICSTCPKNGAAAEAIRRTLEKKGITIEFIFYPWVQAQKMAGSLRSWDIFPHGKKKFCLSFFLRSLCFLLL